MLAGEAVGQATQDRGAEGQEHLADHLGLVVLQRPDADDQDRAVGEAPRESRGR